MGMTTKQILQGVHDWTNGKIVYDISIAHPDGQGNPTPYADLTAALGNGGANIPEPLRKGGMSVKFIKGSAQSSDNKYVQYRLMHTLDNASTAVADFVNTANWQGVDDEPTEGSGNLVKSGGVWSAIQNVKGNELLVIAEALNSLYADYIGLAKMLATNLGETKAECIDFRYMPKVCGQPLVIEGEGAPSVLPYFVGQRYHDTTNKKCYEAFAVTGATSDWTLLN